MPSTLVGSVAARGAIWLANKIPALCNSTTTRTTARPAGMHARVIPAGRPTADEGRCTGMPNSAADLLAHYQPQTEGAGHPGAEETAQVVIPVVRRRAAERVLAVRLHPLPAHPADGSPGADAEILAWLDDHSRLVLSLTAHYRVTGPIVLDEFRAAVAAYGIPASTLTDNGMVYTTRFSGGRGGRNGFEHELRRLGVRQKNGRPNHPQTHGKVERLSADPEEMAGRPEPPAR